MSTIKTRDLTRSDKPVDFEGNIRDLPRRQTGAPRRPEDANEQTATLIRRVAFESTREIDRLIDDLHKLRQKLDELVQVIQCIESSRQIFSGQIGGFVLQILQE